MGGFESDKMVNSCPEKFSQEGELGLFLLCGARDRQE